jgi:hypothetical protein
MEHFSMPMDIRISPAQLREEDRTAYSLFESADVQTRATWIDLTKDLCNDDYCDLVKNGKALYFDRGHLSKYGSLSLAPTLSQIFTRMDSQGQSPPANFPSAQTPLP